MNWLTELDVSSPPPYPLKVEGVKLTIEPVPEAAHFINLRTTLRREDWNRVRRYYYQRAHYRCQICGGVGDEHPVECHEVWAWEPPEQRLVDCAAICPACHAVKHPGFQARQGNWDEVFTHLRIVNDWSLERAIEYFNKEISHHATLREVKEWKLNIRPALALLNQLEGREIRYRRVKQRVERDTERGKWVLVKRHATETGAKKHLRAMRGK